EKDDTDTVFAVREAMRRGFTEFLLIGVVGQRLDHTLGNVAILAMLHSHGCRGKIIDDYSDMELVAGGDTVAVSDDYPFFSLLALGGNAEGVTIKNAKYELSDALLTTDYPYGVSNEPIPGKRAEISLRSGRMLIVKVFG
ncbi:MAG: thiamine diphosphokinase, partial [Oscillospiraceae bacterium]|nr:thiamine diphosphokinase [Oscillospiraceae bacterium]